MAKNLVIVESPAKAKTIEKFLGKDFKVLSSFGHVRDLSRKNLSVDVEKDFTPKYEISTDKKKTIKELEKAAKDAEVTWLATDEDREGEAISWHLLEVLKLDESKTRRIVFHEITKTAILKAIENPRSIDHQLVNAQQARRVLDRLVGYELSPVLWKKVKPALSAGRVQSVSVRLIVEREDEIKKFKSESSFRVMGEFSIPNQNKVLIKAELNKRFKTREEAEAFLGKCIPAEFHVSSVVKKPAKKSPAPPFTTSTLQQEASRKMGYSVSKTMVLAQQLYESGKITYMRTDSVNLSGLALGMAKKVITNMYGEQYLKTRQFKTKDKSAQEAHEAIRPTFMENQEISGDPAQKKLYELIWKRTLASQMAEAQLEKTNININAKGLNETFVARGEVIKFDGFLKVYLESTDEEDSETIKGMLPALKEGEVLNQNEITATERFTQPPARYTEASLVKKMEELGIGRPSTYAPTISTIQKREYVVKEDRDGEERKYQVVTLKNGKLNTEIKKEKTRYEKSKLFPTDIGTVVTRFLVEYFGNILDYSFTAKVEMEFDEIAQGLKQWNEMIRDFYQPFHKRVDETLEKSKKQSGQRELGIDPKSGKKIYAKIGRYGPIVQIGEVEDEEKPRFAGMKKEQSIETISLEEALELFKLPRPLGEYQDKELIVALGRFGPYVRHNNKFFSLAKTDDPMSITRDRAIELIEAKLKKDREAIIRIFDEDPSIQILNGRYGPYIKQDKKNFKIPKGKDPKELSLDDCLEIIKKSPKKKARRKK